MIIRAELNRYRQAPRKVRLLADLIKGKDIDQALALVSFSGKRAGDAIKKLINSAVANAVHNFKLSRDVLYVKDMQVNGGVVLKRGMPRAFGRSFMIKKRTSKILLELGVKEAEDTKTGDTKKAIKKASKPKKVLVKK